MRRTVFALTTALQVFANADTGCPTKSASSGPRQTALIELYTSEGCSSCPPVDRWLSGLPAAGFGPQQVVALAFHVDYWDYLGWRDGFASATNTARQHRRAEQAGAGFVYTPQLLINGADWRGASYPGLRQTLSTLGNSRAQIGLQTQPTAHGLTVAVDASQTGAQTGDGLYVALYENQLSSAVAAGENEGALLHHDGVVRKLLGPFPFDRSGKLAQQLKLDFAPGQVPQHSGVASWIEVGRSGQVVQAVMLSCAEPSK